MPGPILFVRAGALGDFVLSLPVLHALTTVGPVHVVTSQRYAVLFPPGATLVPGEWVWRGGPPPAAYSVAVAFSAGTAEALRSAGVREVLSVAPRPPAGVHAVDHYAGVLGDLVRVDRTPRVVAAPDPTVRGAPVVLAPGSGGAEKRWPMERWLRIAELLEAAGVPVVWVRGPDEVGEAWPVDARCPDLAGLAALAAACRAWVGPDAGPSHLAAAVGARVGVVFGATDPACWAPVGAEVWPWDVDAVTIAAWAGASGFTHR